MFRDWLAQAVARAQRSRKAKASMIQDTLSENCIEGNPFEMQLIALRLMEDSVTNRTMPDSLSTLGVRLAIDDLSTRHALLSDVKRFNIGTRDVGRSCVWWPKAWQPPRRRRCARAWIETTCSGPCCAARCLLMRWWTGSNCGCAMRSNANRAWPAAVARACVPRMAG